MQKFNYRFIIFDKQPQLQILNRSREIKYLVRHIELATLNLQKLFTALLSVSTITRKHQTSIQSSKTFLVLHKGSPYKICENPYSQSLFRLPTTNSNNKVNPFINIFQLTNGSKTSSWGNRWTHIKNIDKCHFSSKLHNILGLHRYSMT